VEQGQQWEELKKARNNLQNLLANPDYPMAEYGQKSRELRERLVSVYLGFTFPKGKSGLVRNILRGSADMYDYLMSSQLLAEASQKLKDSLLNYNAENVLDFPQIIQTPQAAQALSGSEKYTLALPIFVENVGLVQKIGKGKNVDYLVYGEYADSDSGQKYLGLRLLDDANHVIYTQNKKFKETSRSIRHFERALEQGLLD
ncbi:hypothetical protein NO1_2008, partial [Candidatus Termititenax aidoneus]